LKSTTIAGGLAAAVLSLGLAACGSASSPNTTPSAGATGTTATGATANPAPAGAPLSRVALAAKATAICTAATAAGRRLKAPADLTTNAHAAATYFDVAVPQLDAETRAFEALTPAPAVSATWEAVLGAQDALDRLADGYRQLADAGQQTTIADVQQLATVGRTIATAVNRLGARCA
jgi:hypothetical protein